MQRVALFLVFLLGCVHSDFQDGRPRIAGAACYENRDVVIEAWTELVGPVPQRCLDYMGVIPVGVLDADHLVALCGGDGGCAMTRPAGIYISSEDSESMQASISIHEWLHQLAWCTGRERADYDRSDDHQDLLLWGRDAGEVRLHKHYATDTVMGLAASNAWVGPCL